MKKAYKNFIKSLLFGILIVYGFFLVIGFIFRGNNVGVEIVAIPIISTIIYCTYTIIDTIKEYYEK